MGNGFAPSLPETGSNPDRLSISILEHRTFDFNRRLGSFAERISSAAPN
jgi:hypothetical protein